MMSPTTVLLPPDLDDLLISSPELTRADLQHLLEWIWRQPHLPRIPEEQVVPFLHSSLYSLQCSKLLIDSHFTIRSHGPELFFDRDPLNPHLQHQLALFQMAVLPRRDQHGQVVSIARLLSAHPSRYNVNDDFKLCIMAIDVTVRSLPTSPGHVVILDAKGLTLALVARASILSIRKILTYFQEGLNLRLKAVHVVNVTPVIDYVMALVKPFLGRELIQMLHFHSGGLDSLYTTVPRDILPTEYGGPEGTMAVLHEQVVSGLVAHRQWLSQQDQMVVDESKRPGAAMHTSDLFGTAGSFRSLEID